MIVLSTVLHAQKKDSIQNKEQRNILKLNLPALAFSAINIQYERQVGDKTSLALGFVKRFNRPVFNYIDRDQSTLIEDVYLSTTALTPEVKCYFNKLFNGPYVGAYGRWRRNFVGYNYRHIDVLGLANVDMKYQENILHIGALLGYQFNLSNDIYVDFWMMGIGMSRSEIKGEASTNFDVDYRNYRIDRIFDNLNGVYHRTFSFTNDDQDFSFYGEAYRAAFRGVGVCLGIRF